MMLYDRFYFTKNGVQKQCFDSDAPLLRKASSKEIVHLVNTNWDGHDFWIDEAGDIATPIWAEKKS